MGETHSLVAGSITPCSSIFEISFAVKSHIGRPCRYGICRIGFVPSRSSIRCSVARISPRRPGLHISECFDSISYILSRSVTSERWERSTCSFTSTFLSVSFLSKPDLRESFLGTLARDACPRGKGKLSTLSIFSPTFRGRRRWWRGFVSQSPPQFHWVGELVACRSWQGR